jgi:hypothetical protein
MLMRRGRIVRLMPDPVRIRSVVRVADDRVGLLCHPLFIWHIREMDNKFLSFSQLPATLQKEAIREGEMLLNALLAVATAADQRALTWATLLIGGATGSLGGGIALLTKSGPDPLLAGVAILFAGALLLASHWAISTISPSPFCFPGNHPSHWLPEEWNPGSDKGAAIQTARAQQAEQIDDFIKANIDAASRNAEELKRSIKLAFWAVAGAGLALLFILIGRYWTIVEPTSEILYRGPR